MKVPRGSVRLADFFKVALESQNASMTQKMLRKSLTNGARKLLDKANQDAAEICQVGLRGQGRHEYGRKRVKKDDEEMKDEGEEAEIELKDEEMKDETEKISEKD